MAFEEIKTQEEFDAKIVERLKREREKFEKELEELASLKESNEVLKNQLNAANENLKSAEEQKATVEELTGKVKAYELSALKTKYALEMGIPHNFASRITGEDEEAIKADAEVLASVFTQTPPAPLASTEKDTKIGMGADAGYVNLLNNLKGE